MAGLLKLLFKEEEKEDHWGSSSGGWDNGWGQKGKGKGKEKGGGDKGKGKGSDDGKFVNPDGAAQSRCWGYDETGESNKTKCYFAHVDKWGKTTTTMCPTRNRTEERPEEKEERKEGLPREP